MLQQSEHIVFQLKEVEGVQNGQRLLRNISFDIKEKEVLALVGPNRQSKLLLIRLLNRMNDFKDNCNWKGQILFKGKSIHEIPIQELRRAVGVLVEHPNIFPTSIYENIAFGLRLAKTPKGKSISSLVKNALSKVGLLEKCLPIWHRPAGILSYAEKQRLCLARTIALQPSVILMERPTAGMLSGEAAKFEQLILDLKQDYTIIIVTHTKQQAGRISTHTAFFYNGQLIEKSPTSQLFTQPRMELTESYITGRLD